MSLYDIEKFEPPPDPDLVCCICQCVLDKAVESPCRHVFCQVCIERWLTNRHTCPTCRKRTKKQDLKPVLPLVQNMLNRLIMKCDYRDNGCLEKIMLEQFEKHVQSCEYEMKTCRFSKCGAKILKMYLTDHERNSCEHRESICEGECGLMIPLSDKGTHNCVAALKAHIEEKNRMIETLKTKLQELNNLSQSLNDQLEQLRQQLDERPRLLSLTSFSGSESDVTDFMSETLSDESLFDEASQQSAQNLDNNAATETENNPENTNTASDVVEQVERTIVTTLFDVSSRLEVVRNQMRAVLDAGFVNHDDNLNLATPALNAIVNNNSTVGSSVITNHTSPGGNYHGNNTNDLNSNRLMQTLNSLISSATDNTEHSIEAQDGDVNPHTNWTSINIADANTTDNLRNTRNNSFSEFENTESNHAASSDYYQYSSQDEDNDRHTGNSSRRSSNNQSFSDHYSGDGRYLQEHVIVSEPPGSPSNSNSSFSSSSSSIPTLSSVQGSPGHSSFNASTPQHDSVFPDSWTDDNCAHSNESLLRLNESPSFLRSDSSPSFLRNKSPSVFLRDRYPSSPSFLCHTPSFLRDKSDTSSRSSHSHDTTDPAIRSEENSNSDTNSDKSHGSLSEASQNSSSEHLNFSDSSNSNVADASSEHHSDTQSSDEDGDKSESKHESGQETCTKQTARENDTADDNKEQEGKVQIENPVSGFNSDHDTGYVMEPPAKTIEKNSTDTSVNNTGNNSRLRERNSVISLLSSSTDESHHNSTHITVSSDSSDDSDKSESIKYLTKRLKRVQKEDDKTVDCKTEKCEEKADNENQSCATSGTDKTVNKDDVEVPLPTGRSDSNVKIRFSRKRRACADQLYQGSHCKKSNVGLSSYGSASNVLGLQGAVPSHTLSSTDQGPAVRRTRSNAIQTSTTGQDNNAQSLNVKIDLSLINYSGQLGKHSVSGSAPSATVTANVSSMNSAGTKHENCNKSDRTGAAQVHKNSSPRTTGIPQNTHRQARYTRHMENRTRSQARVSSPARSAPAHNYNTRTFQLSWCDDLALSDSSDDSYVPGSDCNDTDITISEEEFESDTSYEVEIPKTTADLLDEYASNDSDESWTVGMN